MKSHLKVFSVLHLVTALASAELIFQPEGLSPGEPYRLIFTTSQVRDATSSDIEDYNAFVQSLADAAPVVGSWGLEWKALGSTATWTPEIIQRPIHS